MEITEFIAMQMESTADWRRGKAKEFPDDSRNLEAAEGLERLAEEINKLGNSETARRIDAAEAAEDANYSLGEWLNEELRAIGFRTSYTNGAQFLEAYWTKLEEELRQRIDDEDEMGIPAPDLKEQVENDPVVKAAREAYETARAEAYAEARKRL
jgi:hypothetical protein